MSISTQYAEFKGANCETYRRRRYPDGRTDIYFTDARGHEFVSHFSRNNAFQGTYPLNRKPEVPRI